MPSEKETADVKEVLDKAIARAAADPPVAMVVITFGELKEGRTKLRILGTDNVASLTMSLQEIFQATSDVMSFEGARPPWSLRLEGTVGVTTPTHYDRTLGADRWALVPDPFRASFEACDYQPSADQIARASVVVIRVGDRLEVAKNRTGKTGPLSETTLPNEALRTAIAFALTRGPVEEPEERTL